MKITQAELDVLSEGSEQLVHLLATTNPEAETRLLADLADSELQAMLEDGEWLVRCITEELERRKTV